MLKRIISLSLIIVMMVSLAGCKLPKATSVDTQTNTNNTESVTSKQAEKERVIEEAKAYLQENYPDDEFTYVSGRSPEWAYNYYELAFTSKKYDDQEVIVYGISETEEQKDLEEYNYYDTYFEYSMKDEAEEYFYNLVKKYFSDNILVKVVIYNGIGSAMKVDNKNNFIYNATNNKITFNVHIKINYNISDRNTDVQNILTEILDGGIHTNVSFLYKLGEDDEYSGFVEYSTKDGIIKEK